MKVFMGSRKRLTACAFRRFFRRLKQVETAGVVGSKEDKWTVADMKERIEATLISLPRGPSPLLQLVAVESAPILYRESAHSRSWDLADCSAPVASPWTPRRSFSIFL